MAIGWFLRATMITQIVDRLNDATYKDQQLRNVEAPNYSKTASADFIVIPKKSKNSSYEGFQMPLHYPRYNKEDYEKMEEWRIDQLLREYGLVVNGSLEEKRDYAMGAFLWPDQM
ncbi:Melanin-concentrating hormone receptor 1 [Rhynchospora pubera]|uniref:Melanin-concentrating hormone receptor 1 n=1 Tax=Rhynchospora pubera TaxID=906938 RepID=A0AAV8HYU2_9POAL|nr:Melanin-concentrating hormone receptor 1 [Rhynchospora pubera]